jgi:hypothetical protein
MNEWRCDRFAELDRLIGDGMGDLGGVKHGKRGPIPGSHHHKGLDLEAYAAKMRAGKTLNTRRRGSGMTRKQAIEMWKRRKEQNEQTKAE